MPDEFRDHPDLAGPMPDDWEFGPLHWSAAQVIHEENQKAACVAVSRSPGTMSAWVGKWRKVYGPDFLPSPDLNEVFTEGRKKGSLTAGRVNGLAWAEMRGVLARGYSEDAAAMRELAAIVVQGYLDDPERAIAELGINDAWVLVRMSEKASKLAMELEERGLPMPEGDTGVPEGLLAGFEQDRPDRHSKLLDRLSIVVSSFDAEDVTEVSEAKPEAAKKKVRKKARKR